MSSSIFPIIQPETEKTATESLPLCREIAWDYDNNVPIFSGGRPVEVTGAAAVKVWCWKALHTERFRHEIYSWDYGCEIGSLIGQAYTSEVKESEAARYVREALTVNPYVSAVKDISTSFSGEQLTVGCTVVTIYGEEVSVNV